MKKESNKDDGKEEKKCIESITKNMQRGKPEKVIGQNINKKNQQIKSETDLGKSDASSLSKHNEQYTALLKAYVDGFKNDSENKRKNKEVIFIIAKQLLIFIPLFTVLFMFATLILLALHIIDFVESIPGLLAALASLIGTFMIIPQMITEYLFNKDEENHLAEIISKIQEYDRDIRGKL